MSIRRRVAASPLAPIAAAPVRVMAVLRQQWALLRATLRWLMTSRETTNYNYEITALNREHLAWWVSEVTGEPVGRIRELFAEFETDERLRAHVRARTAESPYRRISDPEPAYGRRVAWYALVRLLRPSVVVETGTDKGLGTCVLAAALLRNGAGRLVTIDVVPDSGWLVGGEYANVTEHRVGPAASVLAEMTETVDLFVHDVHHTADEERAEYDALAPLLSDGAVIVNDNAHSYDVLPLWSEATGRRYVHFHEHPANHWYPGSGLGAAVPR